MSKRVLILEDDDTRIKCFMQNLIGCQIMIVKEAIHAINYLNNETWDLLFLDHDLGGEQMVDSNNKNTGSEVARWLNENPIKKPPAIILHSFNPVGRLNMKKLLPESFVAPGIWTTITTEMIEEKSFNEAVKNSAESQTRSLGW